MIERAQRPGDVHAGKWNGLGGKLLPEESPAEGAAREFQEEAGLSLCAQDLQQLGKLEFPRFKRSKGSEGSDGWEDWQVEVFGCELDASAQIRDSCEEGSLHWVPYDEVLRKNLWPGDRLFLPYVLREPPQRFSGRIEYEAGEVKRFWIGP